MKILLKVDCFILFIIKARKNVTFRCGCKRRSSVPPDKWRHRILVAKIELRNCKNANPWMMNPRNVIRKTDIILILETIRVFIALTKRFDS